MPTDPVVYLGLDQGSGASKGLLVEPSGKILSEFSRSVTTTFLDDARVEQSPLELLASIQGIIADAKNDVIGRGYTIGGIGIALQRSGATAWRASDGVPVHPMLSWRDTRTRSVVEGLRTKHTQITDCTSLPASPHYAAPKMALLQGMFPDRSIHIGTLDTFILHHLSGGAAFAIEEGMASRTMLYNLAEGEWSRELVSLFGVDLNRLPLIVPSLHRHTEHEGIPVTCVLGDQQAALLGRSGGGGDLVVNLGTISSVCVDVGEKLPRVDGFITNVMYSKEDKASRRKRHYFIEGVTNTSGYAFEYLLKKKKYADSLEDLDLKLDQRINESPVAFFGIGGSATPWWRAGLGSFTDARLDDEFSLARSLIEHCGFSVARNIDMLRGAGLTNGLSAVVSGGFSLSSYLCQTISDAANIELTTYESREATALGAARGAMMSLGINVGEWNNEKVKRVYRPQKSPTCARFNRWKALESRVLAGRLSPTDREVKI